MSRPEEHLEDSQLIDKYNQILLEYGHKIWFSFLPNSIFSKQIITILAQVVLKPPLPLTESYEFTDRHLEVLLLPVWPKSAIFYQLSKEIELTNLRVNMFFCSQEKSINLIYALSAGRIIVNKISITSFSNYF